jgi:5-methyltetrahydrofolate--homocysteine methyltransferase
VAQYEELKESIIAGDMDKVGELVQSLLDKGTSPTEVIQEGLIRGMAVVGERMKAGEMFIPEVLASAHAMSRGMELVKPLIVGGVSYAAKVLMGQVEGDVHSIGRKFVGMILESGGFEVVDIGEDVPADKFIEAVKREQPNILGLSSLLTTTMPYMKDVIETLKRSNLRDKVRVIVGGASVTQDFADSIGADGYAPDAISAVDKVKQLLGQR